MSSPTATDALEDGAVTPPPPTPAELESRAADLAELLTKVVPLVQADGGDLALVRADYVTGEIELRLSGSCSTCAISATTLSVGVARILHDRFDWVTAVGGDVEEAADPLESMARGTGGWTPIA